MRRRAAALRAQTLQTARRARRKVIVLAPLLVGLAVVYRFRVELFGNGKPARLAIAGALLVIGWSFAQNLGRALAPKFANRLDPWSGGVAGFLIRLIALVAILLISLRVAGLQPGTIVVGASVTAVVIGLAAQQTVGNVLAGIVLLSANPFRIGDRVRFAGFGMDVEGTVVAHGLLYVTLTDGEDLVLVPNSTALTMSVRPLREPAALDMRARLPVGTDPETVQDRVAAAVNVPTKGVPQVSLEEFDGSGVVFRIRAIPVDDRQGGRLAREVLEAVADLRRSERAFVAETS